MFLPINMAEAKALGWGEIDILLISGDAYVDHSSFGAAIIGKYLVSLGYRVGILPQPDIKSDADFKIFPKPRLFIGITSGNVDSMVANYTSNRKIRSDDAYSENNKAGKRPDRALIAYTSKVKQHYKSVPVVLGGVEASLRRLPHYDYWSEKVRNSVLFDSKADILVFGNGEYTIKEIAERLDRGEELTGIKNTAIIAKKDDILSDDYIELPSFEEVRDDKELYGEMIKSVFENSNPYLEKGFIEKFQERHLIVNPPQPPLTEEQMDEVYNLDYERKPHPSYKGRIPAYDMIVNSVTIHRGCFGGCSFCAIGIHQGKFISSRSEKSIMNEIEKMGNKTVTDLGGPSANMYKMGGKNVEVCKKCKRISCLYPNICKNLNTDHSEVISLYKKIEKRTKFFVNSGIRHDLAVLDKRYIKELVKHTSGLLKVAPEHTQDDVLDLMFKPDIAVYEKFVSEFLKHAPTKYKVLPYLISSFPGCSVESMVKMAKYLKKNGIRIKQVQDFLPTPMTIASCFYHTERDIFKNKPIYVPKKARERRLHRALMQYFMKENADFIYKELKLRI